MSCSPNTPVKWSDIYDIAVSIDSLADSLNTPNYTPLVDSTTMPFKFEDLESFSGAIRFAVSAGTTFVTEQHLTDGVQQITPHKLDPVLLQMGKTDDLFLVVEDDGCWCKTIFKVDTTSGVPRVEEVEELGCCQSLFVPQPGDYLDYSQHIIPAGHAQQYATTGNPTQGQLWEIRPACAAASVSCGYKFQSTEREAPLTDCTREISSAKFTWPIRKKYMDALWSKITQIAGCGGNGGSPGNSPCDCTKPLCDLMEDANLSSSPGCLDAICDEGKRPWREPTCGGEYCDDEPKVYCTTLQDMEDFIEELGSLKPWSASQNGCCVESFSGVDRTPAIVDRCSGVCTGSGGETGIHTMWTETWKRWRDPACYYAPDCNGPNHSSGCCDTLDCCWEFDECEASSSYTWPSATLTCEQLFGWDPDPDLCDHIYDEDRSACSDFIEDDEWVLDSTEVDSTDITYADCPSGSGNIVDIGSSILGGYALHIRTSSGGGIVIRASVGDCSGCEGAAGELIALVGHVLSATPGTQSEETELVTLIPVGEPSFGRQNYESPFIPFKNTSSSDCVSRRYDAYLISINYLESCHSY